MPEMIFTSVDLPAPLSPTRPTTSASRTSKSTRSSACTGPNALLTPSIASSGVFVLTPWSPRARIAPVPHRATRSMSPDAARGVQLRLRDARSLARRRVGLRADLLGRPERVLDDRVLDVVL